MVRKGAVAIGIFSIITVAMLLVSTLPPEITSRIDIQTDQNTGNIFDFNGTGTNSVIDIDTIFNFNETNTNSVIDTSVIITESDDTLLERFLDEQGIGFTEKFGIITNVAVLDSDQNVETFSDVLNIPIFSVTDNSGRILDLGAIQVTMQSISAKEEANVNIWGTVEFFLDDAKVDTKNIWASGQNIDTLDLSLVDSLTFEYKPNADADVAIASQLAVVTNLNAEYDRLAKNQSNSGRFVPDPNLPSLREQINIQVAKLNALENSKGSDVKRALAPSFSQQEKRNHTFTLSDEGRGWVDQSEHTYRVVITEVHAKLESDNEIKEFNWSGQNVAYELKVKVNGSKKVILDINNSAIEIFKSDGKLKLCGTSRDGAVPKYPPNVTVKGIDGNIIIDDAKLLLPLSYRSDAVGCSDFGGIPRGADLLFEVGGKDYPVSTPDSQSNYYVTASMSGGRTCGGYYCGIVTSNFGYP